MSDPVQDAAPTPDETRLSDERVDELLKEPGAIDPTLLAALREIQARRVGDRVRPPPAPRAAGDMGPAGRLAESTLVWARGRLERDAQNLCDDPHGWSWREGVVVEISVLEAWEELLSVGAELGVDIAEAAKRGASDYEWRRLEGFLERGRWARDKIEPEEQEAL